MMLGMRAHGAGADSLMEPAHTSEAEEGGGEGGAGRGPRLPRLGSPRQEGDHVLGLLRLRGGGACRPRTARRSSGRMTCSRRRSGFRGPGRVPWFPARLRADEAFPPPPADLLLQGG